MKERPILFSAPMVRAILDGRKSQTRRVVKLPKSIAAGDLSRAWPDKMFGVTPGLHVPMPDESVQRLRNPWDWPEPSRLWVRETYAIEHQVERDQPPPHSDGRPTLLSDDPDEPGWQQAHYRATDPEPELCYEDGSGEPECRWRPSIFMPRWASRIMLEITDLRLERLQDITEADAIAEGIDRVGGVASATPWRNYDMPENAAFCCHCSAPTSAYRSLWESINGPGSWDANPFVWVIQFRRV